MIRRILSSFFIIMLLLLTACGSKATTNDSVANTEEAPKAQLIIKAKDYEFDQKEYHIKKGIPIRITLENTEGHHGIKIEGLGISLSSKNDSTVITPQAVGQYEIKCSIPCGPGHKEMKAVMIVS